MKKLWMLSFANIRKSKGHTVSLLILFFISGLLLNAGLLVFLNFGSYFEKTEKELNATDMYYIIPDHLYNTEIENYIDTNDSITEKQKEESYWATGSFPYNGNTRKITFLFNDMENQRELSKWKFVGEHLPPDGRSIYVPSVMNIDGGYQLNDTLEVTVNDQVLKFTIKGFTEDIFFSSFDTGIIGCYLPHDTYEQVAQTLGGQYKTNLYFANLKQMNNDVQNGIRNLIGQDSAGAVSDITNTFFCIDLSLIRLSRITMASIVSIMTVAFAVIITAVCLIVVKFRIGNSIEDDMTKIGSLKSVGYTSGQIISSIILQFSLIAAAGSIVGISASYFMTPVLSQVFAHQSGLHWMQGFDGVISGISLLSILVVVVAVSFLSSRSVHKLNPIVALRGGVSTHSFRKNHLPLDTSKGSLPTLFAGKSILQNKKQSFMMAVIFTAVSFASAFGLVMFFNTVIDTKAFAETPGIEISNVMAILNPGADDKAVAEDVRNLEGVRKVQYVDQAVVKIENSDITTYVMDDFSQKETDTIYTGRYPLHSNEIALSGHEAALMHKSIGDTVTLKAGNSQADYLISGLSQGSSMGGTTAFIRTDGMKRLIPNFKHNILQIYLNKGVNAGGFIDKMKDQYGSSIADTENVDKDMQQGMGLYTTIVSKVGISMLVINILVEILVLYFVINSSVIRKKRELGIQKAIGFTTFQLMNQISLSFLPSIVIGVVLGSLIGTAETNVIMTAAMRSMGIMRAHFIITPSWIALYGAGLILVSYLISLLITYRIRKISAYSLVNE